jgi:DNA-binding CsgD family transcriptional regulator
MRRPGGIAALAPLLVLCLVVGLVASGLARGYWPDNIHNGVLGFSFGLVGAGVLLQRPGQREGTLFLVLGVISSVMFFGRQVGLSPSDPTTAWQEWLGWLGVWPVAVAIAATTWCVLCFPEGRFLSPAWRRAAIALSLAAAACSLLSALWPVEYESTGVLTEHPLSLPGAQSAAAVWDAVAHPLYVVLQLVWVPAVVARWRASDGVVRRQLAVVLGAVALSAVGLLVGLVAARTARPGILLAALVPFAAGWAIDRMSLAKLIERETEAGRLDGLTPRENDVLDLMAQGLSNAAISARLHLSIKTVEPVVSSIFVKLGLPVDSDNNRRVLAVLEYLRR